MSGPKTNLADLRARMSQAIRGETVYRPPSTDASLVKPSMVASSSKLPSAGAENRGAELPHARPLSRSSSVVLTPKSQNVSPVAIVSEQPSGSAGKKRVSDAGDENGVAAPPPKKPRESTGKPGGMDTWTNEKLVAMMGKNHAETLALMRQKMAITAGGDDEMMDEDPEMIEMKITMLEKRHKELEAALKDRMGGSSSSASATSSHPAPPSAVPQSFPTPPTEAGPSRIHDRTDAAGKWSNPRPKGLSSDPMNIPTEEETTEDDEADIPLAQIRKSQRRSLGGPSTPPPARLAAPREIIRASSPSPPAQPPHPPPPLRANSSRTNLAPAQAAAAIAEFNDVPIDDIFSSPLVSPAKPIRAESSRSRAVPPSSQLGGPGPSSSAARKKTPPPPPPPAQNYKQYPWTKEVEQKLRQIFQLGSFRHHQREAIDETLAGKDVFVLMPTGGGKSLTYQLPAVCSSGATRGITFVVSPLISLINDQARHLSRLNIPAIAYTSDLTETEKRMANQQMSLHEPHTKIVYVTPEMLVKSGATKRILRDLLERKRLARFVIDEAHCVSQWGHDFRADYLRLGELRKEYPGVPIMALTATAQRKVQQDIIRSLGMSGCTTLLQSFNRPNLHYEIRNKQKNLMDDMVAFIDNQRINGQDVAGIIYCSSRDKCEVIAKTLREDYGKEAHHFHAGMSKGDRAKRQEGWQEHKFEIVVATIAFGMGIDKPDVRYVIHHSMPRSLEGYYQETGRAGRDGQQSHCLLYYAYGDSKSVMGLIDRDKELNEEQKQRQKDNVQHVLRYCVNKTDCRRTQVLRFFNEDFDSAECNNGCDVCLARGQNTHTEEDVTDDARLVLQMVRAFDKDDRISVQNAADCFVGRAGNPQKRLDRNPHFGAGKDWERNEAERLVQTLLIEGALDEFYVTNKAGWNNAYVCLGPKAKEFIKGDSTLKMDFRAKSPRKPAAGPSSKAKPKRKSGQSNIDAFTRRVSNPIARKRSLQTIADEEKEFDQSRWGDTDEDDDYAPDDEDPIEGSDDGEEIEVIEQGSVAPWNKPKVSGTGTKGGTKPKARLKSVTVDRTNTQSPVEGCFKDLRKFAASYAAKNKQAPVLADETLQTLAAMMPVNARALAEVEGITTAHLKAYATKLLGICVKWRGFTTRPASADSIARAAGTATTTSAASFGKAKQAPVKVSTTKAGPLAWPTLKTNMQSFAYHPPPPLRVSSASSSNGSARGPTASGPSSGALVGRPGGITAMGLAKPARQRF